MSRFAASPTPAVLVWARKSAGLAPEIVAARAKIETGRLLAWEDGTERPSLAQLRRVAAIYKRPLAVFYLPEAPKGFAVMTDYRRLPEGDEGMSPELLFEIRRANDRRDWALELFGDLELEPPRIEPIKGPAEDPEAVAVSVRNLLGARLAAQSAHRADYEALRYWRTLVESAGVITFQATEIAVVEARGFSISSGILPVAVVNSKDAPRGRVFTLLHEVAHVLLNRGGVCDLHEAARAGDIEPFCNRVAGAALFPRNAVLTNPVVSRHRRGEPRWEDAELQALSRSFGGSREAALVRLLTLGMTTQAYYEEKREQYQAEYEKSRREAEAIVPPHRRALASAGSMFTRLVIESFNRERITASDVADYLQVRLKHLPEIQRDLQGAIA